MKHSFTDLIEIMSRLRAPEGCPWDREQTPRSLLPYLVEESTELIEALQADDPQHVCEELGDVLLQVVFHAQMASEAGQFTIHDVIDAIASKLVRRHPHVFSDAHADTPEQVTAQWDLIKAAEKSAKAGASPADQLTGPVVSALHKIPKSLPSLARAQELQKKAAKVGFDWPAVGPVLDKVVEEIAELKAEMKEGQMPERLEDEMGDIFFALVNVARHLGLNAEMAMLAANAKFERRFRRVETLAHPQGLPGMSLEAMDRLWDQVKREEKSKPAN